jgi:hypothetical protein
VSQLAIEWTPGYIGGRRWDAQIEALRSAVKHLTSKEVAYALDVGGTHLDDALHGRERKVWHARWTHVVKAMLLAEASERSLELWRAVVDAELDGSPWTLIERAEITVEDENSMLRSELARFGDAGKSAASKVPRAKGKRR